MSVIPTLWAGIPQVQGHPGLCNLCFVLCVYVWCLCMYAYILSVSCLYVLSSVCLYDVCMYPISMFCYLCVFMMCVCMHVCILSLCFVICVYLWCFYVCVYVYVWCVYVCLFVCMRVYMYDGACVEIRRQPQLLVLTFHLVWDTRLAHQSASRYFPVSELWEWSHTWLHQTFTHVLGIHTQIIMFMWQALYPLSYFPNPRSQPVELSEVNTPGQRQGVREWLRTCHITQQGKPFPNFTKVSWMVI